MTAIDIAIAAIGAVAACAVFVGDLLDVSDDRRSERIRRGGEARERARARWEERAGGI